MILGTTGQHTSFGQRKEVRTENRLADKVQETLNG